MVLVTGGCRFKGAGFLGFLHRQYLGRQILNLVHRKWVDTVVDDWCRRYYTEMSRNILNIGDKKNWSAYVTGKFNLSTGRRISGR